MVEFRKISAEYRNCLEKQGSEYDSEIMPFTNTNFTELSAELVAVEGVLFGNISQQEPPSFCAFTNALAPKIENCDSVPLTKQQVDKKIMEILASYCNGKAKEPVQTPPYVIEAQEGDTRWLIRVFQGWPGFMGQQVQLLSATHDTNCPDKKQNWQNQGTHTLSYSEVWSKAFSYPVNNKIVLKQSNR